MKILGRMLVVLAGGLIALLPPAEAATCKGGKRADSAGRCKATTAKKPSAKAKAKAKAKARTKAKARNKAAATTADKGPLYVFIESGGCRILATESSVKRMQEIAVGGSVTWDGRCAEGLISGTGVLRQEGVFIEGGRSKHFAYYYSGKAKNGVRTGPWTRESLERFDDSARSWTSLARVEFLNGVAKGAPKPIPVRGADQHSKSFTTRVLDPEAKRAQAIAPPVPPVADADALSLRAAAVATVAPAVVPAAPPPSMPAPVAPGSQTQASTPAAGKRPRAGSDRRPRCTQSDPCRTVATGTGTGAGVARCPATGSGTHHRCTATGDCHNPDAFPHRCASADFCTTRRDQGATARPDTAGASAARTTNSSEAGHAGDRHHAASPHS